MFKMVLGVALVAYLVNSVISSDREAEQQASRNQQQAQLLTQMEALNTPAVSRLVDDWRTTFPEPSDEKLTELRVMAQRVSANPASAAKFTTEARQASYDRINNVMVGIGGPMKADGPGLN